ncbi:hypothetical protein D6774_01055 [Candidatus Woesearchaeota archaeon]|nr:MAG: hypothetical protein D6774_01055 [Candidatus Woesearchaeota archaeon]
MALVERIEAGKEFEVTTGNVDEFLKQIQTRLRSGMPVIVSNFSYNQALRQTYPSITRVAFYSDGRIIHDAYGKPVFGMKQVGEVIPVVTAQGSKVPDEDEKRDYWHNHFQRYSVGTSPSAQIGINAPRSGLTEQYNEGTFSPAGPSSWTTSWSKSQTIEFGWELLDRYPEVFRHLDFMEHARNICIDHFYTGVGYLLHNLDTDLPESINELLGPDIPLTRKQRESIGRAANHAAIQSATLRGISNLVNAAIGNLCQKYGIQGSNPWVMKIPEGRIAQSFQKNNPVSPGDYVINLSRGNDRPILGFIKLSIEGPIGSALVHPCTLGGTDMRRGTAKVRDYHKRVRDMSEELIETITRPEFIERFYPVGVRK